MYCKCVFDKNYMYYLDIVIWIRCLICWVNMKVELIVCVLIFWWDVINFICYFNREREWRIILNIFVIVYCKINVLMLNRYIKWGKCISLEI